MNSTEAIDRTDPTAGRQPRSLRRLRTMLKDQGWQVSVIGGEVEQWRHYGSPAETLAVPRYEGTSEYDRLYDAAVVRLSPLPSQT